ncbi:hypothetical protein LINGRAHAP2_LOCUS1764, partial [Linum grandiflorum]
FFPLCDDHHYSLIVVNLKDKRFEYLDSVCLDLLVHKWSQTADRVVKYATVYINKILRLGVNFETFTWNNVRGIIQPVRSKECGIYVLNLMEFWEGQVERYMVEEWKKKKNIENRRDAICLKLIEDDSNIRYPQLRSEIEACP